MGFSKDQAKSSDGSKMLKALIVLFIFIIIWFLPIDKWLGTDIDTFNEIPQTTIPKGDEPQYVDPNTMLWNK